MHRQRTLHGSDVSEHAVQLFDMIESLAAGVASFLAEGLSRNATLLIVGRPQHIDAINHSLQASGHDVPALIADGRLMLLDAKTTLRQFMRAGTPDAPLFNATIGDVVRRLIAGGGGPLYIYGEMVDLLAEEGSYSAVEELEDLWNQLGEAEPFSLLCGYASSNFAAPPKGADRLRAICQRHTRVQQGDDDMLGNWLLNTITDGSLA